MPQQVIKSQVQSDVDVGEPVGGVLLKPLSFEADLGCLRSIISVGRLLEPGMCQCLLCCDAVLRVVDEDLPKEVQEVLEEGRV